MAETLFHPEIRKNVLLRWIAEHRSAIQRLQETIELMEHNSPDTLYRNLESADEQYAAECGDARYKSGMFGSVKLWVGQVPFTGYAMTKPNEASTYLESIGMSLAEPITAIYRDENWPFGPLIAIQQGNRVFESTGHDRLLMLATLDSRYKMAPDALAAARRALATTAAKLDQALAELAEINNLPPLPSQNGMVRLDKTHVAYPGSDGGILILMVKKKSKPRTTTRSVGAKEPDWLKSKVLDLCMDGTDVYARFEREPEQWVTVGLNIVK